MIKFPKTSRLRSVHDQFESWKKYDVVVSEKLDGANSAISFSSGGELLLQSRGHILRGGAREKQFDLFKVLANSLVDELFDILSDRYLLFGEWMYAKHKVFYDALPGYFLEYDLYDKEKEEFLLTDARKDILKNLSLPSAPILYRGKFNKISNFGQFIGPSKFKSNKWKEAFEEQAQKMGLQEPRKGVEWSDLMEGVYVKVESKERVEGRFKLVREGFEKVRSDDENWWRKPIFPNIVRVK